MSLNHNSTGVDGIFTLPSRLNLVQEIDLKARSQSSFDYGEFFTSTEEEGLTDNRNHSLACLVDFDNDCELCCLIEKLERDVTCWSKNVEDTVDKKWNQDYQTDMDAYVKLLYSEDLNVASQIFLLVSLQRRINFFQHVDIFYKEILYYWANGQILSAKTSLMNLRCLIKSEMYICIHCYNWEKVVNFLFADIERELLFIEIK